MSQLPAPTAVLLCSDLSGPDTGLDTQAISDALPRLSVSVVDDLCDKANEAVSSLEHTGELVLGLCSAGGLTPEQEASFREAGHDPIRIGQVGLRDACAHLSPERAVAKAAVLLSAASARAISGGSSGPPRLRPRIPNVRGTLGRRSLFTLPVLRYQPIAEVDVGRCTHHLGCRICETSCPVEALTSDRSIMKVDAEKCTACGICLTACPLEAIDLAGHSLPQVAATVAALLETDVPGIATRAIVYVCESQGGAPSELSKIEAGSDLTFFPVSVPCTGMLAAPWLLGPLAAGARAVWAADCGDHCGHRQTGRLNSAVGYCREVLASLSLEESAVATMEQVSAFSDSETIPSTLVGLKQQPVGPFLKPGGAGSAIGTLARASGAAAGISIAHQDSPVAIVRVNDDTCTGCGNCARVCPTEALVVNSAGARMTLDFNPAMCVGCDLCLEFCPEAKYEAIAVEKVTDIDLILAGVSTQFESENAICENCGAVIGPIAMIRRIERTLTAGRGVSDTTVAAITTRCNQCAVVTPFQGAAKPDKPHPPLF